MEKKPINHTKISSLKRNRVEEAYYRGEVIEFRPLNDPNADWDECPINPHWDWDHYEYRVKLNARPYDTMEEFMEDYKKIEEDKKINKRTAKSIDLLTELLYKADGLLTGIQIGESDYESIEHGLEDLIDGLGKLKIFLLHGLK